MNLLYKNEKPLFIILLIISLLIWGGLIVGTKGVVLGYVVGFFVFYVFAQSAFISYLKGTAVEITHDQYPDLHANINECCKKLELAKVPHAYLMHVGGAFNALATRFLGRNFIVLFSDIVDALEEHPDALRFYIGHEIGHLKRNHLLWSPVLAPASFLPLIGAAYSRAREYSCDRHGLVTCNEASSAQVGLVALAAGAKRWQTINAQRYVSQTRESSGFWMSLHELLGDYPWLTKRVAAVQALAKGEEVQHPGRHPLAWFLALFFPRFGVTGGAGSGVVVIAMMGVLAAIAIPAYQDYVARAQIVEVVNTGRQATQAVSAYYQANNAIPQSLDQAGFTVPVTVAGIENISISPDNGKIDIVVSIQSYAGKKIVFVPSLNAEKQVIWQCGSNDIEAKLLPLDCRG